MKIRVRRQSLLAFEAVARFGSYGAAAEALSIDEKAVRAGILELERRLGQELFTVDGDIALTPAAARVLSDVQVELGIVKEKPTVAGGKVQLIHVAMAVAVALVWGAGFVFAKAAIDQIPPILLMSMRFGVTALALIWFVRPPPRHMLPKIFWASLVSAAIQYSLTFTGLKELDASIAIILVHLEVPFGTLLAVLVFREVLGWRRAIGMLVAFIGVMLISGEPKVSNNYIPMLLCVSGAFMWAIGQIMVKRIGSFDGFSLIAWIALFASPQLLVSSLLFESGQWEAVNEADWVAWGAVIYLGLVMTALGYGMWYRLLTRYQVNQVMPYLLLIPVFTVAGGVFVLGEVVSALVIVGGIISTIGVAIIVIEKRPSQ